MIHDAIKEGDEEFLAEVLEALNKKYNLGAYLKREDKRERNICIGEENTNNGDRKESEDIMEDPNQVSSEERGVEEADSEQGLTSTRYPTRTFFLQPEPDPNCFSKFPSLGFFPASCIPTG